MWSVVLKTVPVILRKTICGVPEKSAKSAPDHLSRDPYTGRSRHRSVYVCTARTTSETKCTLRSHGGAALLSRSSLRFDALPYGCCSQMSTKPRARGTVRQVGLVGALAVNPNDPVRTLSSHDTKTRFWTHRTPEHQLMQLKSGS